MTANRTLADLTKASQSDAETGTDNVKFLTSLSSKQAIDNFASTPTISTDTTASAFIKYLVDTSGGAVTLTLPASPVNGDMVEAIRQGASAATIARNGKTIASLSADLTIDTDGYGVTLLYNSTTGNWIVSGKVWA